MPDSHYVDHRLEAHRMAEIRERHATIRVGSVVWRMDRDRLWVVLAIRAGRALVRPERNINLRNEWASLDDLVRVSGS